MTEPSKTSTGADTYHEVADKVGLIPNVRLKDNVAQGIAVAATTVVGAAIGGIVAGSLQGALIGALGGIVVGGFVSGLVLMVVGLVRRRGA